MKFQNFLNFSEKLEFFLNFDDTITKRLLITKNEGQTLSFVFQILFWSKKHGNRSIELLAYSANFA